MRTFHVWNSSLLAMCLLAAAAVPARARDAGNLSNKEIDALVYATLRDIINKGADLYNPPNSDYAGCWRLYEGALTATRPYLAHRPDLQTKISTGLRDSYNESSLGARAF